jgi:hypothetical protein
VDNEAHKHVDRKKRLVDEEVWREKWGRRD